MNLRQPFPLAVIVGFGTVFAMSLLMILLPAGLPEVLYDVTRWTGRGFSNDMLLWLLPLISLIGYFETGFVYAIFANRELARTRAAIDLVDEVGKDDNPTRSFPQKGAMAGALAGLFASLLSLPIFLIMTYINLPSTLPVTMVLVGGTLQQIVSLVIAVVLGAVLGAVGAMAGAGLKTQS
jgi:hypothetical protein